MTEAIGFTRANLPANTMMSIVNANIKTATDALNNAKATMAKYANATDPTSINLYQQAEKSAIDAENIIKQNNAMLNSIYSQFDLTNADDVKSINVTVNDLLDVKGSLSDDVNKNKAKI